uniref:ribosomal protein L23 n=1 Tax=Prototheca lentecrescens TaxID=2836214 RepID=UPI00300354E2
MLLDLLKYPLFFNLKENHCGNKRQYLFDVNKRLTKPQIKKLIENYFQIKVLSINTHRPPRKKKTVNRILKRVYITVNSTIELLEFEPK